MCELVAIPDQAEGLLAVTIAVAVAVAVAGDVAEADAARSAAAWLAEHTRSDRGDRPARAARRTSSDPLPAAAHRAAGGAVSMRQAEAITRALEALGRDSPAVRQQAEERMIAHAATLDAGSCGS